MMRLTAPVYELKSDAYYADLLQKLEVRYQGTDPGRAVSASSVRVLPAPQRQIAIRQPGQGVRDLPADGRIHGKTDYRSPDMGCVEGREEHHWQKWGTEHCFNRPRKRCTFCGRTEIVGLSEEGAFRKEMKIRKDMERQARKEKKQHEREAGRRKR